MVPNRIGSLEKVNFFFKNNYRKIFFTSGNNPRTREAGTLQEAVSLCEQKRLENGGLGKGFGVSDILQPYGLSVIASSSRILS